MTSLTSHQTSSLKGEITPPGDKSISHRSIILGSIADGITRIDGLLEGEDILRTLYAMQAMGAQAEKRGESWFIEGKGLAGLHAPTHPIDMGNSGTGARLLMGLVAGLPFRTTFIGDASLSKRPMRRIIEPLTQMGAAFESADGKLPVTVFGTTSLKPIDYALPVASAQIKSAILLAGLSAHGTTIVRETITSRDHSEIMLRAFGAVIETESVGAGGIVRLTGPAKLTGQNLRVPADISAAAFPLVAALLHPDSHLVLRNIGLNPRRIGLLTTLREMGAVIEISNQHHEGGEVVGDLIVRGGVLHGVDVPADRAPSMIDEYPVLAVAASCATGVTRMRGLQELRVKESDRLALIAEGLQQCGANAVIEGDDLIVTGNGQPPVGGASIRTAMDHRIAMSFLVMGTATAQPVTIDDGGFIATSFPDFVGLMNGIGGRIGTTSGTL